MSGETKLARLLATMSPELSAQSFVFYTTKAMSWPDIGRLQPKSYFQEKEGVSLIVEHSIADLNNLHYEGVYRCITLNVHSSLEAVGLTAAVSDALTQHNISANVVAAYFHDHIFVNNKDAKTALEVLTALSNTNQM
ncbi:ACT domain-containing protein [Aliiglaciecola litoralis]|uniref:ACT domain-containing protein n=1 Tax=Aliiglaciecola litoralis TaxID=582857 RepID=A0ABP3WRG2_9ALTE